MAWSDHCRSRLDPQMGAAFLASRFQTPALHERAHDLRGRLGVIGGKPGFGRPLPRGITGEHGSESAVASSQSGTSRRRRYTAPTRAPLHRTSPAGGAPRPSAGRGAPAPGRAAARPRRADAQAYGRCVQELVGGSGSRGESRRKGATSVTCCRAQWRPRSSMLYAPSPSKVIGVPGSQRRSRLTLCRARAPSVLWRIPSCALTSGGWRAHPEKKG
jgi:hypothetical protein